MFMLSHHSLSFKNELLITLLYTSASYSLPLGWIVKLTPICQLSSSLVLTLYQTNATDINPWTAD